MTIVPVDMISKVEEGRRWINYIRFLFFLPPPGADFGGGSWCIGFGVATRDTTGAGVADIRLAEDAAGSGSRLSTVGANAKDANEAEECAAVACIAFMSRALF